MSTKNFISKSVLLEVAIKNYGTHVSTISNKYSIYNFLESYYFSSSAKGHALQKLYLAIICSV